MDENNVIRWTTKAGWTVDYSMPQPGKGGEGHFHITDKNGEPVLGVNGITIEIGVTGFPEFTFRGI